MADSLKDMYDLKFYQKLARETLNVHADFDIEIFVNKAGTAYEALELKDRMYLASDLLHELLPDDFEKSIEILYEVAPLFAGGFTGMLFPDFVSKYGLKHFDLSMQALKFFTSFSSSEFAVRPFLREWPEKTLKIVEQWSRDSNHHVRRLASEGTRPRLPWSFQLVEFCKRPELTFPILENLREDDELYVRNSVANHLNDISKDNPEFLLDNLSTWDQSHEHTAWIVKHAARTLIKQGHPRSFALFGFTNNPKLEPIKISLNQKNLKLGDTLKFNFRLKAGKGKKQKLAVDYIIHYMKKNGKTKPKVFKIKELELISGEEVLIEKSQTFQNFSTRKHYSGEHAVEIVVNGKRLDTKSFNLKV